jgi:hypothetical protein
MSEIIAVINMMEMPGGEPGVQFSASPEFLALGPVEKSMYIAAVLQLCGMAMSAICDDHPDVADEIMERFGSVDLELASRRMN